MENEKTVSKIEMRSSNCCSHLHGFLPEAKSREKAGLPQEHLRIVGLEPERLRDPHTISTTTKREHSSIVLETACTTFILYTVYLYYHSIDMIASHTSIVCIISKTKKAFSTDTVKVALHFYTFSIDAFTLSSRDQQKNKRTALPLCYLRRLYFRRLSRLFNSPTPGKHMCNQPFQAAPQLVRHVLLYLVDYLH